MNASPSPTNSSTPGSPQFFQRKTTQVQAVPWPQKGPDGDWDGETVAAIFNWVGQAGGRLVWRTDENDATVPTMVNDDGEVPIADGEFIVRLPGFTDATTGKPSAESRWIVETAQTFGEDYTDQQRQRLAAQTNFLVEAEKLAKRAEIEEDSMTPAQRREAANMDLHKLGSVVNKGGQQ